MTASSMSFEDKGAAMKQSTKITLGIVATILAVLLLYSFIWLFGYPNLGSYCAQGNIVKSSTLDHYSAWDGAHYKTTFTDGTQAYTGYVKKGAFYCVEERAHFWPWDWSKRS